MRAEIANEEALISRRWRPALMAFFLRRVGNFSEAEDLTQEVFVRMLKVGDGGGKPDAYCFQIAANLLVDRSRKARVRERHRESLTDHDLRESDFLDPSRFVEGQEGIACLIEALRELPERTRTMFVLFHLENMSQATIGATYGISASAVKQQIAKAMGHVMKKMREVL